MAHHKSRLTLMALSTPLGWMAFVDEGGVLRQLTIAHPSRRAAVAALQPDLVELAVPATGEGELIGLLRAYIRGERVNFGSVKIDLDRLSQFRRRVVRQCRKIPYGKTVSYGRLAEMAGSPRAARAVGSCMAANQFPLIVPCHRVVSASGQLGAFSAPGGTRTKRRLLAIEAVASE